MATEQKDAGVVVAGEILVGTAGWADRDLVASDWYPAAIRTPAGRLEYYAAQFPLVEVDTTYYAIPREQTVLGWAQADCRPGFVMDVKAYSLFTGQSTPAKTLPKELRGLARGDWLTAGTVPPDLLDAAWECFHKTVEPLRQAGRLGLITLQFPASYRCDERTVNLVGQALACCAPLQAAVEFRHPTWLSQANRDETLRLLREHDAAYVCVDMPQGQPDSVPPVLATTADKAVVRMHGQSPDWRDGNKEERYRYEYSDAELAVWATRAHQLSQHTDEVHIVVNTCCAGAAQRAAALLQDQIAESETRRGGDPARA